MQGCPRRRARSRRTFAADQGAAITGGVGQIGESRHEGCAVARGRAERGERRLVVGALVDAIGDMRSYLRERYGPKTRLQLIAPQRGLLGRRLAFMGNGGSLIGPEIAAAAAAGMIDAAEEHALWQRYGLLE